jgi:hypothetical protein
MVRPGMAALASLAALAALAAPVVAGPLDDARKAVDASDYLAARTQLTAALEAGGASPADLAEIYKLTGIVEGALGETDASSAAFARWLALEPKGDLPSGTSPKILRPFTTASAKAQKHDLLKVKTETSAAPPSVTLVLAYDPLDLVKSARAFVRVDGGAEQTLDGAPGKPIALPKGKRLDVRLVGLDEHGNRVVELGSEDVPIVIVAESGSGSGGARRPRTVRGELREYDGPQKRPFFTRWQLYAGGAVLFGGIAAGFGLAARSNANELDQLNATSQDHRFSEAQDLESAGRRDATLCNVGLGVAAAMGATAVFFAVFDRHPPRRPYYVNAVPTPGGGAFVVGGQF